MTTVSDIGFYGLKTGMQFRDLESNSVDYYEIIESDSPLNIDVECHTIMGNTFNETWYDYEITLNSIIGKYVLIEEVKIPNPSYCYHTNKKKVILVNTSGYWLCPDCQKDLGNLSYEELMTAVKEQFGGKECKRAPEMGQTRKRR